MVEDGASYRGNSLGSENKAGMGKSCTEDNEEITLGEVREGSWILSKGKELSCGRD